VAGNSPALFFFLPFFFFFFLFFPSHFFPPDRGSQPTAREKVRAFSLPSPFSFSPALLFFRGKIAPAEGKRSENDQIDRSLPLSSFLFFLFSPPFFFFFFPFLFFFFLPSTNETSAQRNVLCRYFSGRKKKATFPPLSFPSFFSSFLLLDNSPRASAARRMRLRDNGRRSRRVPECKSG